MPMNRQKLSVLYHNLTRLNLEFSKNVWLFTMAN